MKHQRSESILHPHPLLTCEQGLFVKHMLRWHQSQHLTHIHTSHIHTHTSFIAQHFLLSTKQMAEASASTTGGTSCGCLFTVQSTCAHNNADDQAGHAASSPPTPPPPPPRRRHKPPHHADDYELHFTKKEGLGVLRIVSGGTLEESTQCFDITTHGTWRCRRRLPRLLLY